MGSRATTPEYSPKTALLRASGCGGLAGFIALLCSTGCPPRDQGVAISAQGADYLVDSCTGASAQYCVAAIDRYWLGMNCCNVYTTNTTAGSSAAGAVPGGVHIGPQLVPTSLQGPLQARMYLLTTSDFRVKSASKCMNLKCGDGGTVTANNNRASGAAGAGRSDYLGTCLAEGLNQGLDGAMPTGLSADGLRNSGDAILFVSIHEASGEDCSLETLRVCAGLAPQGGTYDIVCASCNGGPLEAVGSYTGPCPRSSDDAPSCFLTKCRNWIKEAGY